MTTDRPGPLADANSVLSAVADGVATDSTAPAGVSAGLLSSVNVEVSVEIGRVRVPLRDLLTLAPEQVLKLDRNVDAPIEIMVNDTLVAYGELVVLENRELGARVTELVKNA